MYFARVSWLTMFSHGYMAKQNCLHPNKKNPVFSVSLFYPFKQPGKSQLVSVCSKPVEYLLCASQSDQKCKSLSLLQDVCPYTSNKSGILVYSHGKNY